MKPASRCLALFAVLPSLALAQAGSPTQRARDAVSTLERAQDRRAGQAAAALGEEERAVDLGRAAEQLESGERAALPSIEEAAAPATLEGSATATEDALAPPPPDNYVVKPGDTLWDLSGRFLNNPWYWPKLWSFNPEIANPHWIYPGNPVRFLPGAEEAPGRLEPLASGALPGVPESGEEGAPEESYAIPRELEDFSRADMQKPQQIGDDDTVAVVGPHRIGLVRPKGLLTRQQGFVTARELEGSGVIRAAFEEKLLLSPYDRAYADFNAPAEVKPGQRYAIYRTEGQVTHPRTGEVFGWRSRIVGSAQVTAVNDRAATLVITGCYDEIERGAFLGPWSDRFVKQVQRRPNEKDLDAFIVATESEMVTEIGEHHLVYLDKGKAEGVEEGNLLQVVRSGDPYGEEPNAIQHDPDLPVEDVGDLLVVDAKEHAAAALVVRSLRELYIGDRAEMRTVSRAAGSASN
jgi:hypothetical protein